MKQFSLIIFILILIIIRRDSLAQLTGGWVEQYVSFENQLNDVKFFDINSGIVVGNNGSLLKTTNSGVNWMIVSSGVLQNLNSIFLKSSTDVYIAGDSGVILKSTDTGNSWTILNTGDTNNIKSILFISSHLGFVAGNNGTLLKSTNSGLNWLSTFSDTSVNFNSLSFINNNFIWAVGQKRDSVYLGGLGYLVKTTNLGSNWTNVTPELSDLYIGYSIFFVDSLNGFCGYCSTPLDLGVLRTTNSGLNWECVGGGINCCPHSIFFINSTTGFSVGEYSLVFKTTDSGMNWYHSSTPLTIELNSSFFINDLTGWAVGNKILKTTNGGGTLTNIITTSAEVPSEFTLYQNYPNPFNPSTKISFDIPVKSFATLSVYNSEGRKIETLHDSNLNVGSYEINFDGSNYPSGVYYYKLETNEFTVSKKMLLLK